MNQTNWENKLDEDFDEFWLARNLHEAERWAIKANCEVFMKNHFRQTLTTLIEECEPEEIERFDFKKENLSRAETYKIAMELAQKWGFNSGIKEYRENLLKAIKGE